MSHTPFNIRRLNVQMANKKLANVGCKYISMMFSTKLSRTFSTKAFLNGKTIHGHSLYDNLEARWILCKQEPLNHKRHEIFQKHHLYWIIFSNLLTIKKTRILQIGIHVLFFCWPFDQVEFLKGQWWDLSPTLSLRQNGLFEWLLCYQFMVCNQSFLTFGAYGQDFKTNKINNHCGKLYIS